MVRKVKRARKTPVLVSMRPRATKKNRNQMKVDSVSTIGKALRQLGGLSGGALGGYFGNPAIGSAAGRGLGALVSKWMGQGDYTVKENSIITSSMSGTDSIPMMHKTGQSIVVRHKEFVAQITGSRDFVVKRNLVINPGNTNLFPWVAGLAAKFEQYRIKGLVYHYVPTSGNAVSSTNPAIGSVMLQTTYRSVRDPTTAAPQNKVELLNEYWACEGPPNEPFCHPIECKPTENPFQVHYVRSGTLPIEDSPLMYDYGVTYVATSGMQADDNVVGDLWVTYELEFMKPSISSPILDPHLDGFVRTDKSSYNAGTAEWFGLGTLTSTGSLGFTAKGNVITIPKGLYGTYQITMCLHGTNVLTPGFWINTITYSGATGVNVPSNGQTFDTSWLFSGANTAVAYSRFNATDPNAVITITFTSAAGWGTLDCTAIISTI